MELPSISPVIPDTDFATSGKPNRENVTLIHLNLNVDIVVPIEMIGKLRTVIDFVSGFHNTAACVSYIKSVGKEKVIVIVFGTTDVPQILSDLTHLRQVDSVFVVRSGDDENQDAVQHEKLVGSFTCIDEVLPVLRQTVHLLEKHLNIFHSLYQHQRSIRDLSTECAEFLWFQIFKDTVMKMPYNDEAKRRMISVCQSYYYDNRKQLMLIDEFERSYRSDEAIQWYTRPAFLYRLVNKALRTEDVEQLDTFRFFIHDLRICLAREHKIIQEFTSKLTVYRGTTLSLPELNKWAQNTKTLISTNGFLSTSRSRDVAEMFVRKSKKRTDAVAVVFEIECDVDALGNAIIFADISHLSHVRDEDEILFDLGVVFCIDAIITQKDDIPSNIVLIKMHATIQGYEIAREYINENRLNMTTTSVRIIFGKLLMDMGQYEKGLRYFQQLIQEPELDDLVWAHVNLGSIYRCLGQYAQAKAQYALAYDLCIDTEPQRYRDAASIIDNLGVIWDDMGLLDEALDCHKFAYKIRMTVLGPDHTDTGSSLINIGSIYYSKCHHESALNCFLRALEIKREWLPMNHPDTAEALSSIGLVYLRLCDYDGALEYLHQALVMQEHCFPANHVSIANTLNSLGSVYYQLGEFDHSFQYYSRSLSIKETCLSADHKGLADTLDNVGNVYCRKFKYDQALVLKLRALKIREFSLPDAHPDTVTSLLNISKTYIAKKDYDLASEYARQALAMEQRLKSVDLVDVGICLEVLGTIHWRQNDYKQSLDYHLKALETRQNVFPANTRPIANSLYNIGVLYEHWNNIDKALEYYVSALKIYDECLPDEHPTRKMAQRRVTWVKLLRDRTEGTTISRSTSVNRNQSVMACSSDSTRRKSFG